jgi:hypothetical protein
MFDGTYGAVIQDIRDEVEAEWSQVTNPVSGQETTETEDGETALLMLILDVANSDALSKLNRYETYLVNAVTRTLQQLHILGGLRGAPKLISA